MEKIKEKNIVEGIVEILEKREKGSVRESEMNDWGIVCKVQEKVVYAKGLREEGISEMVEFEGLRLREIINYLDKNLKVGITIKSNIKEVKLSIILIYMIYGKLLGKVVNLINDFIKENFFLNNCWILYYINIINVRLECNSQLVYNFILKNKLCI